MSHWKLCLGLTACLGGGSLLFAEERVNTQETATSAPAAATSPASNLPVERDDGDTGGNKLRASAHDVHALILEETNAVFAQGTLEGTAIEASRPGVRMLDAAAVPADSPFGHPVEGIRTARFTSRVIETPFPFNEICPSWNVEVPEGTGFIVHLRVGRKQQDLWSPWYYLGQWGAVRNPKDKHTGDELATIETDYLASRQTFDRMQYSVTLFSNSDRTPVLRRFGLAYSNALNDAALAAKYRKPVDPGPKEGWARRLPVPFRSQKWEDEKIRGSICSPTSTSMVMEYRGVKRPTVEVCRVVFDREYKIYGTWPRAVQGAFTFGVPGYIERFGDFEAVKRHIANGQPVIASIRVKQGQLRNAPYRRSAGHLLVITGFDEDGNVLINDPAGETPEKGVVTYHAEDMKAVWLDNGGVGYILLPPAEEPVSGG